MQQIKGRNDLRVVALELAILRAAAPVMAAEKPAKLRTAYVSPIGAMAPVWMAAASSAFQTEGVDVELVYIQSTAALPRLLPARSMRADSAPAIRSGGAGGRKYHDDRRTSQQDDFSFPCQKEFKSGGAAAGKDCGRRSHRIAE